MSVARRCFFVLTILVVSSLANAASLQVTFPNGGETWATGGDSITWNNNGAGNVKIELLKAGTPALTIINSFSGSSFYWSSPSSIAPGNDYTIRVTSVADGAVNDVSDAAFTIPVHVELYMSGSTHWGYGRAQPIGWTANTGSTVRLELYKGGAFQSIIADNETNDGNFDWAIPANQTPGTDYAIRLICPPGGPDFDEKPLTIEAPMLQLFDPSSAGIVLARGFTHSISWDYNVPESVTIELVKASPPTTTTIGTGFYGYYSWAIPADQAVGNDYKIRITSTVDGALFDESDNVFSIEAPSIGVTVPAGGESWQINTTENIQWSSNLPSDNLTIELLKNGALERTIDNAVYDDGFYSWPIPGDVAGASDYAIRITSNNYPTISGTSNVFSITSYVITVTDPNNTGISIAPLNYYTVTWNSAPPNTGDVTIEIWEGTTTRIETIDFSTANDGSYNWYVSSTIPAGSNYHIKIGSDFSDNPFTISGIINVGAPASELPIGLPANITWSSNMGGDVKIEYKLDIDPTYTEIDPAVTKPNNGSYTWNVPPGATPGNYEMKITSLLDTNVSGTSFFSLQPKRLALFSPDGGETFIQGEEIYISWDSNLGGNIKIELNDGTTTSTLIASTPNDGSYQQTLSPTQPVGSNYRVIITSLVDAAMSDQSANPFTIAAPQVLVTSPNNATPVTRGLYKSITWTKNFAANVKVELLKGGVVQGAPLVTDYAANNYNWLVPVSVATDIDYQIKVSHSGNVVSDASDANFPIQTQSFTITQPAAGQRVLAPSTDSINWNTEINDGSRLKIDLYKGGLFQSTIDDNVASYGSYSWNVPAITPYGADYRIRIARFDDPAAFSESAADFEIAPQMLVVSPNGGEHWPVTDTKTITWISLANPANNVKIELTDGAATTTIIGSTPDDGSYDWAIPGAQPLGSFKVIVTRVDDAMITDQSDSYFNIEAKYIAIDSPNGNEDRARGFSYNISWSTNFGGNVKIELLKNGTPQVPAISDSTPNDGIFDWTIPAGTTIGSDYKIRITHLADPVSAESAANFAINDPSITLTYPDGADEIVRGSPQGIGWSSNYINSGSVKIELLNNGTPVVPAISDSTVNNGNFTWNVPASSVAGTQYRIRITSLDTVAVDQSNADFSIIAHNVTMLTPNGSEEWSVGTTQTILWNSNFGGSSTVKLELLKAGSPVLEFESAGSNTGTYAWNIPANFTLGTDYRVRVTSNLDTIATDSSDADFTIRPNQLPVASAGADQTVKETAIGSARVWLNGAGSTDDGSLQPLTYTWKEGSTELGAGSSLQYDFPLGDHTVTLVVNDGQLEASDTVLIRVLPNEPPVANAGPDQTVTQTDLGGSTVTLSAGNSTDDGSLSPLTYVWKEGETVLDTNVGFSRLFSVGDHTITLTINDGQYESSDSVLVRVLPVPNLTVTSIIVPPEAYTGRAFDLKWTDNNIGQANATDEWVDRIYLSADDQPGGDQELAAFPYSAGLNAGQSVTRTQVITIPRPGILDQQYRIFVVTDSFTFDSLQEINEGPYENDNTAVSAPFNVHPLPIPDLIVAPGSIVAPATAFSDAFVSVQYDIKNIGAGATDVPQWLDRVYVSADPTPGNDPIQVDATNVSYLATNEVYRASVTFRIPRTLSGPLSIIVKADDRNSIYEEDEVNNILSVPILIQIPSVANLRVAQVTAPEDGFAGEPITIGWTVQNVGDAPAEPDNSKVVDYVYLSADQTLDTADTKLGEFTHHGSIAVNDGYARRNESVTLPKNIQGAFYIFVQTDSTNQVFEHAGESDNSLMAAQAINILQTPQPDLIAANVTAPPSANAGDTINVSWTDTNQGGGAIENPYRDGVYLSADTNLDGNDILLGFGRVDNGLGAGLSVTPSATLTIPAGISGTYYVIVMTDPPGPGSTTGYVQEFDPGYDAEANNVAVSTNTVNFVWTPPDLQVTASTAPSAAAANQLINVSWTVTNRGAGDTVASRWYDNVYLSPNSTFDGSAVSLSSTTHDAILAPSETYSASEQILIPLRTAPGNYFLFVKTDTQSGVLETGNEENNVSAAIPIAISATPPDLQVTNVTAPANADSGRSLSFTWTVRNAGTGRTVATSWIDGVWLSTDTTLDTNDMALFNNPPGHYGELQATQSYTGSASVKLPYTISGTYYLIIQTDPGPYDNVFEAAAENNNTGVSSAINIASTPAPDLRVTNISLPPGGTSGQPIDVTYTVTNSGTGPTDPDTPSWNDFIYVSRDQVLDPTDPLVGSYGRIGALNAAQSYTPTVSVELPRGISGPYYVFVVTDRQGAVFEADESNNSDYVLIQVTLAPPSDLVVNAITPPAGGMPGEERVFAWECKNIGPNNSKGYWVDTVYLSKDNVWDIKDAVVGSVSQSSMDLATNATYSASLTAKLPTVIPADYYVLVRTDIRDNIREENENNNIGVSGGTLALDVPELTLGVAESGSLSTDTEKYYKVNVPAGQDIVITLDSQSATSFNEIYLASSFLPTRSLFELSHDDPNQPDHEIILPEVAGGYYYILIRGGKVPDGPAPYTLNARVLTFEIVDVSPSRGSTRGKLTSTIRGAKFTALSAASLVGPDSTVYPAAKTYFINGTKLIATFDLRGLQPDLYDVRVDDQANFVTLDDSFTVIDPTTPEQAPVLAAIFCPQALRLGTVAVLTIGYTNDGENDLDAPVFTPFSDFSRMRLTEVAYRQDGDHVVGINFLGIAGILPPGSRASISYSFTDVGVATRSTHTAPQYATSSGLVMNWPALEGTARPPLISDATWNPLWSNFIQRTGPTYGGFVSVLDDTATQLSLRNRYVFRVIELFHAALNQSFDLAHVNVSGRVFLKDVAHPMQAGVSVNIYDAVADYSETATTRADGTFSFDRIPTGAYDLTVEGYSLAAPVQFTVATSAVDLPQIIVIEGGVITGVVRDGNGAGISDATIVGIDEDGNSVVTTSGTDGTYRLGGLLPGTYDLTASAAESSCTSSRQDIEIAAANSKVTGIDFSMPLPGTITGVVSKAGAGPVLADAEVSLAKDGFPEASTITDAAGAFELANILPGSYELRIKRAGYAPKSISPFVLNSNQLRNETIELQPAAVLTVNVTSGGTPMENASVLLKRADETIGSNSTDATGNAVFSELAAATYTVAVDHETAGKQEVSVTLSAGEQRTLNVTLAAVSQISGTATLQSNGSPVSQVRVLAVPQSGGSSYEAVTDAAGTYVIKAVVPGTYALFIQTSASSGIARRELTVVGSTSYTEHFVIAGGSISGTLFKAGGTDPVAFATVSLIKSSRVVLTAAADGNGRYCFTGVAAGAYQIEASGQGAVFDRATTTLAAGQQVSGLDLTAGSQSLAINLQRQDNSAAITEGFVSIRYAADHFQGSVGATVTGATGVVVFDGVPPGDYIVSAGGPGLVDRELALTVSPVGPNGATLQLEADVTLQVTVQDGASVAIVGASVVAYLAGQPIAFSGGDTDATGVASLGRLIANTYDVYVSAPGYLPVLQPNVVVSSSGGTLNVTLAASTTSLNGSVADVATGRPIIDALVAVTNASGRTVAVATSDFSGNYAIDSVIPGAYTVTIEAEGFDQFVASSVNLATPQTVSANLNAVATADPFFLIQSAIIGYKIHQALKKFIDENNPKATKHPTDNAAYNVLPPIECINALKAYEKAFLLRTQKRESFKQWEKMNSEFNWQVLRVGGEFALRMVALAGNVASLHPALGALKGAALFGKIPPTKTQALLQAIGAIGAAASAIATQIYDPPSDIIGYSGMMTNLLTAGDSIAAAIKTMQYTLAETGESLPIIGIATGVAEAIQKAGDRHEELVNLGNDVKQTRDAYFNIVLNYNRARAEYIRINQKCPEDEPPHPEDEEPPDDVPPPPPDNNGGGGGGGGSPGSPSGSTSWQRPGDPNEKKGPEGFGAAKFIKPGQVMTYTVYCENVPTATAPVQRLTINDDLDSNLDLRTYRIVEIEVGDVKVPVPDNSSFVTTRVELGPEKGNVVLDVFAGFDIFTGRSFLKVNTLDPATGERPTLPELGFMPPNDSTHRGEGHITYRISPKVGLATGTVIPNTARIIFDDLERIDTNEVSNTIDGGAPQSAVEVLPASSESPNFTVSWSGTDDAAGSGVKSYDIYVSDDNGPYTSWLTDVTFTSALFEGARGHTYRFYSIARDNVDNVEAAPAQHDATIATGTNYTPVAVAQTIGTNEDTAAAITLSGTDGDNDALTFAISSGPANGTLSGTPPNLTYAPNGNFNGSDSFTFTVHDGLKTSAPATVGITVSAVDDAPLAANDSYDVSGGSLNVAARGVLANDSDAEGASLSAALVTAPALGTLALNSDGSFTYTAGPNFIDTDTFKYAASDGSAQSAAATVTLVNVVPLSLASGPTGTPNPAIAGDTVQFSVTPNISAAACSWDFGDGAAGSGSSASHIFASAGTYRVSVTATAGTQTVSATLTMEVKSRETDTDSDGTPDSTDIDDDNDDFSDSVEIVEGTNPLDSSSKPGGTGDFDKDGVSDSSDLDDDGDFTLDSVEYSNGTDPFNSASKPGGTADFDKDGTPDDKDDDDDNDGASDLLEISMGTSPFNAASKPVPGAMPPPLPLKTTKLSISLNFSKAASDSLQLMGLLPVASGFAVAGKPVVIDIGGVTQAFTLDSKGAAKLGTRSFKIAIKAVKGAVAAQKSKFGAKMKGSFAVEFADENLTGDADVKSAPREVVVSVLFDGKLYQVKQPQLYTARQGKTGKTK